MKCYEEPRKTNEETDSCAAVHRDYMSSVQQELTKSLMQKSVRIAYKIIKNFNSSIS